MGTFNATQTTGKANSVQGVETPFPKSLLQRLRRLNWRRLVGWIGVTLIVSGLLLLGLIAYQLWGTGFQTREAQRNLEAEFKSMVSTTTTSTTAAPTSTTEPEPITIPNPEEGDVIAHMYVKKMGLDVYVVEGVKYHDLKIGPGHYPDTPMIGQLGNVAIAGHRSTYDAPFGNIEVLEPGDKIQLQTTYGSFTYEVTGYEIVAPTDVDVIANPNPDVATLTLTTCHPKFSSSKRYIVYSKLVKESSTPVKIKTQTPKPDKVTSPSQDAFTEGWWHDSAAWPHVLGWTLALLSIVAGVLTARRRLSGRFRFTTAVACLVALVPFVFCLYFFYENVSRLLPTNL